VCGVSGRGGGRFPGRFRESRVFRPGRGKPVADAELAILERAPRTATDLGPSGAAAGSAWAKSQFRSRNRELQPRRCSGGRRTIWGKAREPSTREPAPGVSCSTVRTKVFSRASKADWLGPERPRRKGLEPGSKAQSSGADKSFLGSWGQRLRSPSTTARSWACSAGAWRGLPARWPRSDSSTWKVASGIRAASWAQSDGGK